MNNPVPTPRFLSDLQRSAHDVFLPVQHELDRVFDQLSASWVAIADAGPAPRIDLIDTKEAVELTAELPGMTRADVKIAIEGEIVTISGEKRTGSDREAGRARIKERGFGAFERSVTLPHLVDLTKITAKMVDGVLTVTAPKLAGVEARTIDIQAPS